MPRVRGASWSWTGAVEEGAANWLNGRWLSRGLTVLMLLALALPLSGELLFLKHVLGQERDWLAAGGSVLVATDQQGVLRSGCESLNTLAGVQGAGAVTVLGSAHSATQPDEPLPIIGVTAGVFRLLGVPPGASMADSRLVERNGWRAGSLVALSSTTSALGEPGPPDPIDRRYSWPTDPIEVSAVVDPQQFAEEYQSALMVSTSADGLADACYVRTDLPVREGLRSTIASYVTPPGATQRTTVSDRLTSGQFAQDYAITWSQRPTRQLPYLAAVLTSVFMLIVTWVRRPADALYISLGASRAALLLIRLTEWVTSMGLVVVLALTGVLAFVYLDGAPVRTYVPTALRFVAIYSCVTTLGALLTLLVPLRSPLAALKDR